ncbi:unnamed protein product [Ceratitis capitata]|uniref:(Mediterranean fruit fly) hypothetical protein n=1 Tax=Ceratitis capitata TaxID=7213 RepID=A0A811UHN5_CERCA|nr:unnamed protein product [Ceratitis capitata]
MREKPCQKLQLVTYDVLDPSPSATSNSARNVTSERQAGPEDEHQSKDDDEWQLTRVYSCSACFSGYGLQPT